MTRAKSPEGVPSDAVAACYRRRAEGGVGLIVSEGAFIPHWSGQGAALQPYTLDLLNRLD